MESPQPLSLTHTANPPPTKVEVMVGSQTPDPDRVIPVLHAQTYPVQVWYFLASFIFLLSVINYTGRATGYYHARVQRRWLGQASNGPFNQEPLIRGSINLLRLPLALTDTFRALSFRWTIPIGRSYTLNVADVVLAAAYIVICLTWSLINTTSTKGVKFDPRYYANIAGNVATIQFPLVVALGMKNNIISWVGFNKLVYLHGMTSRVLVVLVWLHAGGRIELGLEGVTAITVPVIQAGILAGVALTLLSIVSIKPARDKAYEFFLIAHLVLAVICVLAGYFHAAGLGFGHYMWPTILLWGLDRSLRILRVAINTFGGKKSGSTTATGSESIVSKTHLELLSPSFLRLTIPAPRFFYWGPGQCVYLTFPSVSKNPFEGHPFTIATISGSKNSDLKFFIRVRNGVTKQLFKSVEDGNDVKVFLDGPYSSPPPLVGYDTVLLIAGGTGVAFTLPLLLDLVGQSKRQGPACRRLTFAWTTRNIDHVTWIQSEILSAMQGLPSGLTLDIHIFVTGTANINAPCGAGVEEYPEALADDTNPDNGTSGNVGENEKYIGKGTGLKIVKSLLNHPMLKTHQGRMDLDTFIKEEVSLAKDFMSVTVCGPYMLASAVRKATRYPRMVDILKGGPTISLHVEASGSN